MHGRNMLPFSRKLKCVFLNDPVQREISQTFFIGSISDCRPECSLWTVVLKKIKSETVTKRGSIKKFWGKNLKIHKKTIA